MITVGTNNSSDQLQKLVDLLNLDQLFDLYINAEYKSLFNDLNFITYKEDDVDIYIKVSNDFLKKNPFKGLILFSEDDLIKSESKVTQKYFNEVAIKNIAHYYTIFNSGGINLKDINVNQYYPEWLINIDQSLPSITSYRYLIDSYPQELSPRFNFMFEHVFKKAISEGKNYLYEGPLTEEVDSKLDYFMLLMYSKDIKEYCKIILDLKVDTENYNQSVDIFIDSLSYFNTSYKDYAVDKLL